MLGWLSKFYKRLRVIFLMKRMDKAGQQMTLGTIIAIVLGIVVLILLVWGFSTGWNNMWSKVTSYGAGSENTGTVIQSCALKCSTGNKYGFCEQAMNTVLKDGSHNDTATCKDLSGSVTFEKNGEKVGKPVSALVAPCPALC